MKSNDEPRPTFKAIPGVWYKSTLRGSLNTLFQEGQPVYWRLQRNKAKSVTVPAVDLMNTDKVFHSQISPAKLIELVDVPASTTAENQIFVESAYDLSFAYPKPKDV